MCKLFVMNFQFVQPSRFLKGFIRHYCLMETDAGEANLQERVIPVENIQLMFHYKKPFAVCSPDQILLQQPYSVLSGLASTFSDVTTQGESGVIFVEFLPAGACPFFKFPLSELENKSIDLTDALGQEVRQVEEQLYDASTISEKISLVEQFLLKKYSPVSSHDYALVQKSIRIVAENGGQISAKFLADKLAVTSKTLERKFSAYIGKSPRQFGKLIRFRKVLEDFGTLKNISLTDYACRNGYFDQSHFIHDFKVFTGYTPKEFLLQYRDCSFNDYEGSS